MAAVLLTDDARDDLHDFDRATQVRIIKALRKLETDPELRGAPLAKELAGYRKLVVGDREIRVIYSIEADGTVAVVWIIGRRANDEVYDLAQARLVSVEDQELRTILREMLETANRI